MLLLLPCVTLCPFSQITRIMLQSLADIILRLVKGNILRDILSYLIPTQHNSLTLIGFLLRHNGLYGFGCELLFFKHLSHTDCLVVGRSAVVQVDFIYQITLAVLVKKEISTAGRISFCLRPQGQAVRGQDWSSEYICEFAHGFLQLRLLKPRLFVAVQNLTPLVSNFLFLVCLLACSLLPNAFCMRTLFPREVSATFENCFPPLRWLLHLSLGQQLHIGVFQSLQAHTLVFSCDRKQAHICRPLLTDGCRGDNPTFLYAINELHHIFIVTHLKRVVGKIVNQL